MDENKQSECRASPLMASFNLNPTYLCPFPATFLSPLQLSIFIHLSATSSMEQVWKDISVSTRENDLSLTTPLTLRNSYSNFQDFLARPSAEDPPLTSCTVAHGSGFHPPPPPPPPPPTTILTLNSGKEICFQHNPDPLRVPSPFRPDPISNTFYDGSHIEGFPSSGAFSFFGKRRFQEPDGNSSEIRHKRLIKNRESAARSRARKQAYTNELELEIAHLMEENARLKRQQEQLSLAAAAQPPRKHALQRSSTAPF